MCPGTLALVGAAASAGGGLVGGIAAGNAAAYQAQVARQNAQIAQQNAQRAAMATSSQVTQAGLKARAQDAGVKAAAAANNLDVNSGSPADVETSQRELGAFDTAAVAQRGAAQTYGYEVQSTSDSAQANLDQSEVIPDYLGGGLKAGGSLLSSAPDLPSNYAWMGGGGPPGLSSGPSGGLDNPLGPVGQGGGLDADDIDF